MPYLICLSCWIKNVDDIPSIAVKQKVADLIEVRADQWESPRWDLLRQQIKIPLIVTIRATGKENDVGRKKRLHQYVKAYEAGCDWIDLDLSDVPDLNPAFRSEVFSHHGILSIHPTSENDIENYIAAMLRIPAAVYKCVLPIDFARSIEIVRSIISIFREAGKKYIVHPAGKETTDPRIFGGFLGNAWTYAACPNGEPTAIGQPTVEQLQVYGVQEKTEQPQVLGLFGYPLLQSSGWKLHNALLQHYHLRQFLYLNLADPDFSAAFSAWEPYLHGASITIPHKKTAVSVCSSKSEVVQKTGVCNTIVRNSRKWHAENTDYAALFDLLLPYKQGLQSAVVVGTGATARTALAVLKELGIAHLYIIGRNEEKTNALAKAFSAHAYTFDQMPSSSLDPIDLLIHATPVGMIPHPNRMLPLEPFFHPKLILLDVVHNPPETLLIRKAKEMGVQKIISGESLFLKQAQYQFAHFTGITPPTPLILSVWELIRSNVECMPGKK